MQQPIPKVSVFIAASLDGYIAREDGSIDWLMKANEKVPPGEDCGYAKFSSSIDTLVMGRNTFELVLTFNEWPYEGKKVVVLSKKGFVIPPAYKDKAEVSSLEPIELLHHLYKSGTRSIYLDGGKTIQSFLQENLVDQLTLTLIPILIGKGRPLFGNLAEDIQLQLVEAHSYPFGFQQMKYNILK